MGSYTGSVSPAQQQHEYGMSGSYSHNKSSNSCTALECYLFLSFAESNGRGSGRQSDMKQERERHTNRGRRQTSGRDEARQRIRDDDTTLPSPASAETVSAGGCVSLSLVSTCLIVAACAKPNEKRVRANEKGVGDAIEELSGLPLIWHESLSRETLVSPF